MRGCTPTPGWADLEADLAGLAADGLRVDVRRTDTPSEAAPASVRLHLLGTDRPGIVAEISRTIAAHGVGIEALTTDLREAPMAGGLSTADVVAGASRAVPGRIEL